MTEFRFPGLFASRTRPAGVEPSPRLALGTTDIFPQHKPRPFLRPFDGLYDHAACMTTQESSLFIQSGLYA